MIELDFGIASNFLAYDSLSRSLLVDEMALTQYQRMNPKRSLFPISGVFLIDKTSKVRIDVNIVGTCHT